MAMNKKNLIKFENLYKIFQTDEIETYAVNGIDLSINEGEYVAIAGPSGCGKSTILSVMGLLDKPSRGVYRFKDEDVTGFDRDRLAGIRNREMGFVFQAFNLIESLRVIDNVKLPLIYRGELSDSEITARAEAALAKVDMMHRRNHYPTQLSGGQQQRAAIARAMINNPSVIFADEPTGNLDSKSAEIVMSLLKAQHQAGSTICIVTHDPRYTRDATRIINVLDGKIAA
jgi:putative ABC transport system ATP-binding protein